VTFIDVREPVYYGPDVATTLEWVRGFMCTKAVVGSLDSVGLSTPLTIFAPPSPATRGSEGVWFDARAWIVAARRIH
jgi:hypothetical protein